MGKHSYKYTRTRHFNSMSSKLPESYTKHDYPSRDGRKTISLVVSATQTFKDLLNDYARENDKTLSLIVETRFYEVSMESPCVTHVRDVHHYDFKYDAKAQVHKRRSINFSVKREVHSAIVERARLEGCNVSQYVRKILRPLVIGRSDL